MQTWALMLAIYMAPPNAVDWDGPWKVGMTRAFEKTFSTQAECRNFAIQLVAKLHQGMLAPIRYKCVDFASGLPKGAVR